MTNLEKLRQKIADPYKYAEDSQVSDGVSTVYELTHGHILDGSYTVYVDTDEQVEDTDYTIGLESGVITFSSVVPVGSDIRVIYQFSAFSDEELTEYLSDNNGNLDSATLDIIDVLLFDSSRRFDYSTGKTEMKPSQVFNNLKSLRDIISGKIKSKSHAVKTRRISQFYDPVNTDMGDLSRLENDSNGY